ncbi:MAG: glycoside hydrolase family 1 protein [Candidatus Moranbacteria bacterium]|nr:glycoside hydrolase family 1 protein [Candidatus Moranbacteria bacterium]
MKKLQFPKKFLWGAATSSHQVEGGTKNQWSKWEKENAARLASEAKTKWQPWQQEKFPEMFEAENYISGSACDHYNRFQQDFDLAKELGHSAHRFSIEWSRIEPEEGKFDEKEIEHYRQVLIALRERGITPFVTLWHWTNPLWLEEKGGCESRDFAKHFAKYAEFVASKLGNEVEFWITLNEPTSVIASAYLSGAWPPAKRSYLASWKLYATFAKAHVAAYQSIHALDENAQVGFANILHSFAAYSEKSWLDKIMVKTGRHVANKRMLNLTEGFNDFLTVQYYFHNRFKFPKKLRLADKPENDLGWEIFPEGIYHILKRLKVHKLPIYVTENGLADAGDEKRMDFIKEHLAWIHRSMEEGADVRGYFYWSLLDNFEWDKGFWPRFGLVEVDFKTQERKIRPSALEYAKICKNNELELE